jgi:hypothetical protein
MLRVRLSRILFALLAVVAAAALGAARAEAACGTGGYSYAGVASPSRAFGVSAVVTPLPGFNVMSGHVAGWVGVGGPGLGPHGSDEWIQVGFSGFPALEGNDLYYEVMRPGGQPTYHQVAQDLPFGRSARVAVLEMHRRPNVWRIWLNGRPVSKPLYLAGSHGRWAPIATAEAWDGGSGACNGFLYRFSRVAVAGSPGGGWRSLVGGYPITSRSTRIARSVHRASFLAAGGDEGIRTLASFIP